MAATHPKTAHFRLRTAYAVIAILVICLGLLWRSRFFGLPPFVAKYGGDALWSLLVFVCVRFCVPERPYFIPAIIAFSFACAVEFSQLYDAPWIDAIRTTLPGRLVLGSTFNWPDIPAYALGIIFGFLADRILQFKLR